MSVPELVRERLRDEQVEAAVSLGDDDALVVTPTRTLLYRGEGLISDASVEEFSHDAETVSVSEGRRTSTIRLDHGVEGDSELSVPTASLEDVLPPLLAGVLITNGVLDAGERIEELYRLGELTVVVAGRRIVKHVGDALWDEDAAVYHYDDVMAVDVEKGEVSSQLIVEVEGRPQWIKVPSDRAREIRERIEGALLAHHDATSYREFERRQEADDGSETTDGRTAPEGSGNGTEHASEGIDSLDVGGAVGGVVDADETGPPEDLAAEVADLRVAIERQQELLESQQRTIEQLIEELKRR
jgi:hypothetical protein